MKHEQTSSLHRESGKHLKIMPNSGVNPQQMPKRALFSWRRFASIVRKEFIQVKRDRLSMAIPFLMPIVMMFLFGYAVNTEVDEVPTAILDLNRTAESRAFVAHFSASGYFRIDGFVDSEQDIRDAINADTVKVGLIIPPDFDRRIQRGEAAAERPPREQAAEYSNKTPCFSRKYPYCPLASRYTMKWISGFVNRRTGLP